MHRNAYVEIDNSIIEANARFMCETFPHIYNIAVVKGNAYGHGMGIIPALVKGGMNAFAVSQLDEAIEIRMYEKDIPIIMLQPIDKKHYKVASEYNVSVCVNCGETFREIVESGEELKLQFKVNSGMNRLGFSDSGKLAEAVEEAKANPKLSLDGIFTHFHTNGYRDVEYVRDRARFEQITKDIDLSDFKMVHVDRTQTVFMHDTPSYANGVRIGVSLYGFSTVYPFPNTIKGKIRSLQRKVENKIHGVPECKDIGSLKIDVKPAFKLMTKVIQVNEVSAGAYVGYGLLHKAEKKENIAVIDIGYADGIGRKRYLSDVAINGKKYKIIGEIGMGMCEVLVDETVKRGDDVTVLGGDIPIGTITRHIGTTMYELLTGIDSSIERIYR